MAKQLINLGTVVNDGTGDVLRVGAQKINENFTELYTFLENSGGQLSLVSSITADDGLTVNASSGNVLIRANIASTTDLGSIRVGSGLQISEGGVLSIIPQESFTGNYNDLSNKPDLSVYQLAANAFSRNYNDLTSKPAIPTSLFNLGIAQGVPGEVLVLNNSNLPEFQTLFNQNLSTGSDVLFDSVTTEQGIIINTSTLETEQVIQNLTSQRNVLQNSTLPGLQSQLNSLLSQQAYWQGQVNSSMPESGQWINANIQLSSINGQIGAVNTQVSGYSNQLSSLNNQIGYLQSTLTKTSTTLLFDHYAMSLVTDVGIAATNLSLNGLNSISSTNDLKLTVSAKQWLFGTDGVITLPSSGDIHDATGSSAFIRVAELKAVVAESISFEDFQTRIAGL